jgi:hypothetical protein
MLRRTLRSAIRIAILSLTASALSYVAPLPARAEQVLEIIRPGTRPAWFGFSLAPALDITNSANQMKIAQDVGYHLSGDSSGFGLGFTMQQSVFNSAFVFEAGPKASYDVLISDTMGVYITPSFMFGGGGSSVAGSSSGFFDMQVALEGKMLINDRGLIFFRPVSFDMQFGNVVAARYEIVFGGGATF